MNKVFNYKKDSYLKINAIFLMLIVLIFFYCWIYSILNLTIKSNCEGWPEMYCKSRGLTRAFSAVLHGEFKIAKSYNSEVSWIFSFFLIQFIFRIMILFLNDKFNINKLIVFDIFFSIVLFLATFTRLII